MKEVKNHNTPVSVVDSKYSSLIKFDIQILAQKVLTKSINQLCENHLSVVAKPPPIFLTTRII
jgi:hypothetical protein